MNSGKQTLLIADDHKAIRDDLVDLLKDTGWNLLESGTAKQTWDQVVEHKPNLVLLDLKLPDLSDLSLLKRIRETYPEVEVIMLTSEIENIELVVSAIKLGAYDYVPKPFIGEELKNRISKALSLQKFTKTQEYLLKEIEQRAGLELLIGNSAVMRNIVNMIRKLATVDGCVLVNGESGTGKELVARAIHYLSKRRSSPFIAINCAGIPDTLFDSMMFGHKRGAFTGAIESTRGKFDLAEDGTIFLDEIGDMPMSQQTSLLRVLEDRTFTPVGETREREIKARIVFATNRDLRKRVEEGTFREDLYFRINVASLMLPSLKTRIEDVPALVDHYLSRFSAEMGRNPIRIDPAVMELFQTYDWPGNVRELKNILEGAIMLLDPKQNRLELRDLPQELLLSRADINNELTQREQNEREEIIKALKRCNGNRTKAADLLGYHRNTIRAKMKYFGIPGQE